MVKKKNRAVKSTKAPTIQTKDKAMDVWTTQTATNIKANGQRIFPMVKARRLFATVASTKEASNKVKLLALAKWCTNQALTTKAIGSMGTKMARVPSRVLQVISIQANSKATRCMGKVALILRTTRLSHCCFIGR